MKVGYFSYKADKFVGAVFKEKVFNLSSSSLRFKNERIYGIEFLLRENCFQTDFLQQLLEKGKNHEEFWYKLDDVTFTPLYTPRKIICLGRNYAEHAKETGALVPEEPIYFEKATSAIIAHNQPIIYPEDVGRVDPEVELAVIVGKRTKNVKEEEAERYVAGYTILNDVTARDMQKHDIENRLPWYRSKSIDTFCPVGPWIVTAEEIGIEEPLRIELRVNGRIRQKSSTKNLLFDIPSLLSSISSMITLEPGDIISTGTPEGISPIYPGDLVEAEIEKIGILKNPVRI